MRTCPTVQGSPSPLIIHRIGADVCHARQEAFFHKCHKCIYRGQSLSWEPEQSEDLMVELDAVAARKNGITKPARKPALKKKAGPLATPAGKPRKGIATEA